jgi:hypothetical protein
MSAGYITGFVNECMSASQGDKARVSQLSALEVGCSALGTQHNKHDTHTTPDTHAGTHARMYATGGHGSCTFIVALRENLSQSAQQFLDRSKKKRSYCGHAQLRLHLTAPAAPPPSRPTKKPAS